MESKSFTGAKWRIGWPSICAPSKTKVFVHYLSENQNGWQNTKQDKTILGYKWSEYGNLQLGKLTVDWAVSSLLLLLVSKSFEGDSDCVNVFRSELLVHWGLWEALESRSHSPVEPSESDSFECGSKPVFLSVCLWNSWCSSVDGQKIRKSEQTSFSSTVSVICHR